MDHFENDWLRFEIEPVAGSILWSFSPATEQRIINEHSTWDLKELCQQRDESVLRMDLGRNPYVALSGGVDSQAACLMLKRVGIKFVAAIMKFVGNFNQHDVQHAINFCKKERIRYLVIELDILKFLNDKLAFYVSKYRCPSPQITSHMWFYEQLIRIGATSIIAGGNPPYLFDDKRWGFASTRSQTAWTTFSDVNQFPLYGNFLGYSYDIALPLMLTSHMDAKSGYDMKVRGMLKTGLQVMRQAQKFNGFEYIKEHYQKLTGDAIAFEKAYRYRFTRVVPEFQSQFHVSDEVSSILINAQR